MNAKQAADRLRALGATIAWGEGEPKIRTPRGTMTPELRAAIRAHKPAILVALDFGGSLEDMQRKMLARFDAGDEEGGEMIRAQMTGLILERSCVRCPGVALAPGDKILCAECRGEANRRQAAEAAPPQQAENLMEVRP